MPRFKLYRSGVNCLADIELIEIIVSHGIKGRDFKSIARDLHTVLTSYDIFDISLDEIRDIKGIGESKAATIFAMIEFIRRQIVL